VNHCRRREPAKGQAEQGGADRSREDNGSVNCAGARHHWSEHAGERLWDRADPEGEQDGADPAHTEAASSAWADAGGIEQRTAEDEEEERESEPRSAAASQPQSEGAAAGIRMEARRPLRFARSHGDEIDEIEADATAQKREGNDCRDGE